MLLQFNFSNFKSFNQEATLDLTATGISEHPDHVVEIGIEKVLPVSAIFGANASGKSNVYQAFTYMQHMVVRSFQYGGSNISTKIDDKSAYPIPPRFAWNKTNERPSMFEVFVIDTNTMKTFNYGFSFDDKGVVEEWLNEKAKTARISRQVFYRNRQEMEFKGLSSADKTNIIIALEPEVLIISLGSKLKVKKCQTVVDWFHTCETSDYGNLRETNSLINALFHRSREKDVQDAVLQFLASFDESIKGFTIKELPNDGMGRLYVETLHTSNDSDELVGINLQQESSGTLKMLSLYPTLMKVLRQGSVLFVDELNTKLHPLLVRNLVGLFTNPETNPNHAQLVFNTHDTWPLSNNSMRRDEIWFTDKNSLGESNLYSLADFRSDQGPKIRKDEQYEKNYLLGKYGAIPSLKTIELVFPDFEAAEKEVPYE